METKFTPAPWTAKRNTAYWEISIFDENGFYRAGIGDAAATQVSNHNEEAKEAEQKANAQLMAASPELYEALRLALEYWNHRQKRYKNRSPAWVQEARAALAKARGEQP